jgi:ubiquinone/menaquinone biosynthesis C-methylase UbiE
MNFDRLAPLYQTMELVLAGDRLHRCRVAWLDEVRSARRILLAGEGHGRFLGVCARELPHARITCVDASREMLHIAERRWRAAGGKAGTVDFIQAELPAWSAPVAWFDLIVTNFFLDCFPPSLLGQVVNRLADAGTADARWLLADFSIPGRGWRRWRARVIVGLLYLFFRGVTALPARKLTPPGPLLERAGFQLARRQTLEFGLLQADLWVR